MIIVEGLDNTGKTTLINQLAPMFFLRQVKSLGPAPLLQHLEWIVTALNEEDTHIIYDRFSVISESVYGVMLRGDSVFKNLSEDLLRLTLRKLPLIIYCRPPREAIFNWGERPQMDRVKENAASLLGRYDAAIEYILGLNNGQNVIYYDYTQAGSLESLTKAVVGYFTWRDGA